MENGPVWSFRYLPWSSEHAKFTEMTSIPADGTLTDDRIIAPPKFKYVSHFILSFNHAVVDFPSFSRPVFGLLQMINKLLCKKDIGPIEDKSLFVDNKVLMSKLSKIEKNFISNPSQMQNRLHQIEKCFRPNLLQQIFPFEPNLRLGTGIIMYTLDNVTTQKFLNLCRLNKVSYNSAFSAVVNSTIVRLLQEANINQKSYNIASFHAVNKRKDYAENNLAQGLRYEMMDLDFKVSETHMMDFWKHARDFHKDFKHQRLSTDTLDRTVLSKLTGRSLFYALPKNGLAAPSSKMFYFGMSTVPDSGFENVGDMLHLEFVEGSAQNAVEPRLWLCISVFVGGILRHSLQYNSGLMSHDTAQKVSDRIFETLREVVEKS